MSLAQAQELEALVPPALRAQVFQKRVEINKYRSELLREAATLRPQNPTAATYQLDVQLYLAAVSNIEQQVADYEYCAWSQSPELYDAHLKLQEAAKLRQSSQQATGPLQPNADLLGLPHTLSMIHHPNFRPSASIVPSEAPDYISDSGSDDSFQSFYSAFTTQEDGSQLKPGQPPRTLSAGGVPGHGAPRPVPVLMRNNSSSARSPTDKDYRNIWNKSSGYARSPARSPTMPASPATKFDSPLDNVTPSMSPTAGDSKEFPDWAKKGEKSPKPAARRNQSPMKQPGSPAQSVAFHTPPSSPLKGSPGGDAASKATTSSRPSTPKSEMLTPEPSSSLPESPDRPSTSQHPQPSSATPSAALPGAGPEASAPRVSSKGVGDHSDHTGGITLQVSAIPYVAATPRITSPPSRASSSGLSEHQQPKAPAGLPTGHSKPNDKPPISQLGESKAGSSLSEAAAAGVDARVAATDAVATPDEVKTDKAEESQPAQSVAPAHTAESTGTSVDDAAPAGDDVARVSTKQTQSTASTTPAKPAVMQQQSTSGEDTSAVLDEKEDRNQEQSQADEVSVPRTPTPGQPNTVAIVSPSSTVASTVAQDFTAGPNTASAEAPLLDTTPVAESQGASESTLKGTESPAASPEAPLMSPAERDSIAEQVVSMQTVLVPRLSGAFGTPVMSLNLDDRLHVHQPVAVVTGQALEEEEEAMAPVQQQRLNSLEMEGAAWDGASLIDGELLKKGVGPQLTSPTLGTESRSASIAGWMAESSRVREVHTGKPAAQPTSASAQPEPAPEVMADNAEPAQVPAGKLASGVRQAANHMGGPKSNKLDTAAQMMANALQAQRLPALEEDAVLSPAKAQESLQNRPMLLAGAMPVSPTFSTNSFEIDRQDLMYSSSQQRAEAAAKVLKQFASATRGAVMMMPQDVLRNVEASAGNKDGVKAGSPTDSDPAAGPQEALQGPGSPMYVHTIFWPDNTDTPRTSISVAPTDGTVQQKSAAEQPRPQATVEENLSGAVPAEQDLPPQLANLDPSALERYRLANGDQLLVVREKANPTQPAEDTSSTSPVAHETLTTMAESETGGISEFLWDPAETDNRLASSTNGDNLLHGQVNFNGLHRQESGLSQSESQSAASSRTGTARMGMANATVSEDSNIRLNGEELVIGSDVFRLNDANDVNMLFELLRNSLLGRTDDHGFTPASAPGSAPAPQQPTSAVSLPGSAPVARQHLRSQSFDRNIAIAPAYNMAPGNEPLANRLFAALTQASHSKQTGAAPLPAPASNLLACLDEIVTPRNQESGQDGVKLWNSTDLHLHSLPQPPPPIRVPGGGKLSRSSSSSAPGYHPLMPPPNYPMAPPQPNRPSLRDTYPVVNTMPVNQVPAVPMPTPNILPVVRPACSSTQLDPRATLLSAAARSSEHSTGVAQSWLSHGSRPSEGLPPAGPLEVMRSSNSTTSTCMSHYMQRPQMSGASVTSQVSSYVPETPSTAPTKIVLRESKGRWRSKKYVWQLVVGGEQQQTGEMTAGSEVATSGPSIVTSNGPPSIPDTAVSMSQDFSPPQEVVAEKKKKRGGGFKAAARLLKL